MKNNKQPRQVISFSAPKDMADEIRTFAKLRGGNVSDYIRSIHLHFKKKLKVDEVIQDEKTAQQLRIVLHTINEILRLLDMWTLSGRKCDCDELYQRIEKLEALVKNNFKASDFSTTVTK